MNDREIVVDNENAHISELECNGVQMLNILFDDSMII